jgi:hypothetical protein
MPSSPSHTAPSPRLRSGALMVATSLAILASFLGCGGNTVSGSPDSGVGSSESGSQLPQSGSPVPESGPDRPNPVHICRLQMDCETGLVCGFGLCHSQCLTTEDCPAPERCVATSAPASATGGGPASGTVNVCQLLSETRCTYTSDCSDPLVCAVDLQCRNQCREASDCLGKQLCVHGVCAEYSEVTQNGDLAGAVAGRTGPGSAIDDAGTN